MVELKGYKINKINFENTVPNGTKLQLGTQVKYNVNYIKNENKCVGLLNCKITDANMNPFEIKVEMVAEFIYSPDDDKADIHTQSFDQLFPFFRSAVNSITALSGMPGLLIPIVRLKKETVQMQKRGETEENVLIGNGDDDIMLN